MTRYSLKVPQFQILIGSDDITDAVVGYSFRHPLAEPSTPLIWTGTIEMFPVRSGHPRSFFDDELNASRWLSGLQPIDVYFNGTWWQRFRIKPSGYRFNQDNGQAEIEITDIIGILDEYQPSADAPEFKTGANNQWNDLAVRLIARQAALMGTTVTVQTPPLGIGGYYQIPRTVSGSYIKEAQKMAGERGFWMWSDKETIKWAEYPQSAQSIVWRRSRKELANFTRQQGLDPVKSKITVSATHEEVDTCGEVYPKTAYAFASSAIIINSLGQTGQRYQTIASITVDDKIITGNYIYTLTKSVVGNPMLVLFGGVLQANGTLVGNPPEVKGYTRTQENAFGGFAFIYKYTKGTTFFTYNWTTQQSLLRESDVSTYENVPLDAQNASKILSRVITRSEPYAKFPEGLQYFDALFWFRCDLNLSQFITERVTTTYTYREIFRDDIIVTAGQKLYEIDEIVEFKEQIYFERVKVTPTLTTTVPKLVPQSKTSTKYIKECQGRWKEIKEVWQNKGKSTTSTGYLYSVDRTETPVTAIPDIIYRPAPFPVRQKPLLGAAVTGYAGVSPFVNSNEFANASTLTTKAECEQYARYLGRLKWQRYYSRELASGYGTTLSYAPFQGVDAGNGSYIRDRFGISLNQDGDSWQFVEDCIGNKTGTIPEIQAPPLPYPPLLVSTLNIGAIANQSFIQNIPISSITIFSTGGQSPYTYSSTTLPSGLSLSSGGVLSGTPTAISTTSVTVTVTDSLSDTDTTTFDIAIVAAPIPIAITSETIFFENVYSVIGEISFLDGIVIPSTVGGTYSVIGEMYFVGEQPDAVVGGTYGVIGEMSFLTLSSTYEVIGEMEFSTGASDLLGKTISFWKFDETGGSGDRVDSHGVNDLTAVGSMDASIGLNGNSVHNTLGMFVSSVNSDIDATTTGFIGFAILTKNMSLAASPFVNFGQWTLNNGGGEITLSVGESPASVIAFNAGSPLSNTWHLINVEIDVTGGTISISVDNGTPTTTAIVGDVNTAQLSDSLFPNSDIYLDNAYLYNAPLNSTERDDLWNNGIPLTYPFTTPQTNITLGDLLIGGTVNAGGSFATDPESLESTSIITSLNSVTVYGLNRATNYADYRISLTNGVVGVDLVFTSGTFTNPTYGLNGDYTFVASGSDWYSVATDPVPTGNYTVDGLGGLLSDFVGQPLNTPWQLIILDENGGNGDATFTGWSFNVDI
jgi:hypothetical protein